MKCLSVISAVFLLLPVSVCAQTVQIYKCQEGDKTIYSQTPCPVNARSSVINLSADSINDTEVMSGTDEAAQTQRNMVEKSNIMAKRRILGDKITRKQNEVDQLEKDMYRKLIELQAKKESKGDTPANAEWARSVNEEMNNVMTGYNLRMDKIRQEVDRLQTERESLAE